MLDANNDQRIYKYNSFIELSQFALAIIAFLFVLSALLDIFDLSKIILNPVNLTTSVLVNFLGLIVWAAIWLSMVYSLPSIEIKEQGLRLKSFPLKPIEVRWEDISYVKQIQWKAILEKRKSSVVVTKNGLTHFHRLCGIVYGSTIQPSFVISSFISDYDDLLKVISDNIKKSRRVGQPR
jgi:hypothetical protein